MKLSIPERLVLSAVLPPAEGNFLFLRAIRTFKEDLGFSEEEAIACGLKQDGLKVSWDTSKEDPMREVQMGPVVSKFVSDAIKAAPKLREEYMPIYSKFVLED